MPNSSHKVSLEKLVESLLILSYNNNDKLHDTRVKVLVDIIKSLVESYNKDLKNLRDTYMRSFELVLDNLRKELED